MATTAPKKIGTVEERLTRIEIMLEDLTLAHRLDIERNRAEAEREREEETRRERADRAWQDGRQARHAMYRKFAEERCTAGELHRTSTIGFANTLEKWSKAAGYELPPDLVTHAQFGDVHARDISDLIEALALRVGPQGFTNISIKPLYRPLGEGQCPGDTEQDRRILVARLQGKEVVINP